MLKPPYLLTPFFLFLILLPCFRPYSLVGNELKDLESTDANFITESGPWVASSLVPTKNKYSQCGTTYLLGGSDILPKTAYFTRTYTSLPTPHDMIYFTINFWLIDSWNVGDHFRLEFDSAYFDAFTGMHHSTNFPNVNTCGDSNYRDLGKVAMTGKVFHSGTSLTLKVTNMMDEDPDNESFGFRDIDLKFVTANATDANSFCGKTVITLPNHDCSCPTGKYSLNPGDCQNCNSACKTCYWGNASACFSCNNGFYLNGSQCLPCHSYCSKCFGPTQDECTACKPTYYLFLGQTCIDSCNPPLVASGSSCDYNCPITQYAYPDGACQNSCNQYLNPGMKNSRKLCQYYCPSSTYYYPIDGTCLSICPDGYYGNATYRYCMPCQDSLCAQCPTLSGTKCDVCETGAVLDTDGICKRCEVMDVQYIKSTLSGDQFRVKLLPSSTCKLNPTYVKNYLLPTNAARTKFPPFSFSIQPIDSSSYLLEFSFQSAIPEETGMDLTLGTLTGVAMIPKKFVPSPPLENLPGKVPTLKAVLSGVLGAGVLTGVALSASSSVWSLLSFQRFIGYFIYINVDYPYQVEFFLLLLQSTNLDFLPNPLASITDFLSSEYDTLKSSTVSSKYQSPRKFMRYDKGSFFIDNGGSTLFIGILCLVLVAMIPLLLRIRVLKWRSLLIKVQSNLKWNGIFRGFLESGIPLTLAAFLQIRKISFDTSYTGISTLFAFVGLIYSIMMVYWLVNVIDNSTNYLLETRKTRLKVGTLYEGLSLKHKLAKYYHLVILWRGILLMFFIAFLEISPVVQIIPLMIYNIGLVYYLFKNAEFKAGMLNFLNRFKEIFILFAELGILCLTFKGGSENYYQTVGWIIVGLLGTALSMELLYMVGVLIIEVKNFIKRALEFRRLMQKVIKGEDKKNKEERVPVVRRSTDIVEF